MGWQTRKEFGHRDNTTGSSAERHIENSYFRQMGVTPAGSAVPGLERHQAVEGEGCSPEMRDHGQFNGTRN